MKTVIPAKQKDAAWTDGQWKAIKAKGQDILVAAAAGSGKTAVLVNRIIEKILDEDHPLDIDRLLVVTFTNASAAEMRHRIGEALEAAIRKQSDSHHLRRQLGLLNKAMISTLHSFCLNVIRKYYYLLHIDPGFRIADDTEIALLRDEVLDDVLEEEYGAEDHQAFYRLVDTFTNDRSDAALEDLIHRLYDFSRSHPQPDKWLDKLVEMYDVDETMNIEDLPFMEGLHLDIQLQLDGAKALLEEAYEMAQLPSGPAPRAENYLDDLAIIEKLHRAKEESWQAFYKEMNKWSFSRAKACRGDAFDQALVKEADQLRKNAKAMLEKLKKELFSRSPEGFLQDMQEMKEVLASLVMLVKKFAVRFQEMKIEKGIVDYADLEHYTLEILADMNQSSAHIQPSDAALSYRELFTEVLVDEYQDVNLVQETILQLVTADSETDGNLFMVGDVKQSIYRFRLAEPNLFLTKYRRFNSEGDQTGLRIDLSKNFRSRSEVLAGTNYIFKQLMGENVGEMAYDQDAELVKGAAYPETEPYPIEVALIDQADDVIEANDFETSEATDFHKQELEQSQLEARYIANKIKRLIAEKTPIYQPKTNSFRPIQYKDIVILLRSMAWTPQIMEELRHEGIPAYANLSTGYFDATEVSIMLSLLQVIDNPYQDIPLAAVLRSPIVGLDEEDLATIRLHSRQATYYEALKRFLEQTPANEQNNLYEKVVLFFELLDEWRDLAKEGALSSLIWQLYRDTRFYDFVGGLPGGKQRQANLRALYDRARQYEATSFRGLFRFLRFIERMRERGSDLGVARALSEQEDVVRLITIHSSKGLEFPVVFIAGLGRKFNMMDLNNAYLLDKEYGFASKYVNPEKRITYPSLPQLAFKRKQALEMLAEEMRVFYVAMTRAKEKLYLIASVKNMEKAKSQWSRAKKQSDWLLYDYTRYKARSYLDWLGPALVRHQDCYLMQDENVPLTPLVKEEIVAHASSWQVEVFPSSAFEMSETETREDDADWMEEVRLGKAVAKESENKAEIYARLTWQYPFIEEAKMRSKQSVSEIKRLFEARDDASSTELVRSFEKPIYQRPRFMQAKKLSPAERGTVMHSVMQHISLRDVPTKASIRQLLEEMERKELLTPEQIASIDPNEIIQFFDTDIGKRMLTALKVHREVPFSLGVPIEALYANQELLHDQEENLSPFLGVPTHIDDKILVQGVIDCVIEDIHGIILLDYKTDNIQERFKGDFRQAQPVLENRYRVQLALYKKALTQIWKKPVFETYLYFFDGGHLLKLSDR
ncbi:helicase-exonuclease AddAB subunit AddA [Bacillus chungangensis]|uniref:ATP-dependent helicase/nuclease subunit A n=1 Tax=Bacillus chungangensis TaxID=587633 RepID=A0ABT9WN67_9BACI|nr:helicase-exonuclease AddAB subunit AddA [Bacillus chungangensis]MDQ0174711.1 ATP-dependent helicase/nuclease subunit A [Bacillus chungangensis]